MGSHRKERPDGFVLYAHSIKTLQFLSDEAAGKAIKAAVAYFLNGADLEDEQSVEYLAYSVMRVDIDESLSRFRAKCERNRKNRHSGDKQEAVTSGDQSLPVVTTDDHNIKEKNIKEKNIKEKNIKEKKDMADEPPDEFDAFWKAYPKKKNKIDAKKAFAKVKVPLQTLLDAIERQKQSLQWQKDGGQFIPYPATWLNRGAWDDELEGEQYGSNDKPGGDDSEGPYRWHGYDLTPDVY